MDFHLGKLLRVLAFVLLLFSLVRMAILNTDVPERLVCCKDCDMWIEFDRSGISCDFLAASSDDFVFIIL